MPKMTDLIPDAETLLSLAPEELAGALVEHLSGLNELRNRGLSRGNFLTLGSSQADLYPPQFREQVRRAIAEAWAWLEAEGFLIPDPDNHNRDWVKISRRGERFPSRAGVQEYRSLALLPKDKLDPKILNVVSGPFARGDMDTAVFAAFKQVEVAVREAITAPAAKIGVDLMREAFRAGTGQLSEQSALVPEQEALAHLFAGAIGYFKNPSGHREAVSDPVAAAETVIFANLLLRIVGERITAKTAAATP